MSIKDRTATIRTPDVTVQRTTGARVLGVLRIAMGLTFAWAFLDKTFGLSYATAPAQSWLNGGSPAKGFMGHVQVGPMQSAMRGLAGAGWVDWLFMIALLGIGVALLLGIGMRVAAVAGTILLGFMWIAEWPLAQHTSAGAATASTNPLIDYHLVYIVVLIALAVFAAGDTWGLGQRWARLDLVRRNNWLR
jgi:thiosulfate dehydrogenase (quinone) large subunit